MIVYLDHRALKQNRTTSLIAPNIFKCGLYPSIDYTIPTPAHTIQHYTIYKRGSHLSLVNIFGTFSYICCWVIWFRLQLTSHLTIYKSITDILHIHVETLLPTPAPARVHLPRPISDIRANMLMLIYKSITDIRHNSYTSTINTQYAGP